MKVVVFRTRLRDAVAEAYGKRAREMYALGSAMAGFVSSKDFTSEDGERLTVIEFKSAETLAAWRNHPEHRAAQAEGRVSFYAQYSLQVCELERESRFARAAETSEKTADAPNASSATKQSQVFEGGCFCGTIRYRANGTPRLPSICHCSICRKTSGAPLVAWATFRTSRIEWLSGAPRGFASSNRAKRSFCADCGTPLTFVFNAHPDFTDVTLGSLDRPARVAPLDHIFTESQIPWLRLADGLPRFPKERDSEQK